MSSIKTNFLVLIRGINVGGNNRVPMAELKHHLEQAGFTNVITYIASGNVIVESSKSAAEVKQAIEMLMPTKFTLSGNAVKVHVLSEAQLAKVVDDKPKGFGEQPDTYHSDVIFLMDATVPDVMPIFSPREGVDAIWPGEGVVYSQRLSAERTKSRLSKIMMSPLYKSMTIRTWNTTVKLLELLRSANVQK